MVSCVVDQLKVLLGADHRARVARQRDHGQLAKDGVDRRRSRPSSRRRVRVRSVPGVSRSYCHRMVSAFRRRTACTARVSHSGWSSPPPSASMCDDSSARLLRCRVLARPCAAQSSRVSWRGAEVGFWMRACHGELPPLHCGTMRFGSISATDVGMGSHHRRVAFDAKRDPDPGGATAGGPHPAGARRLAAASGP